MIRPMVRGHHQLAFELSRHIEGTVGESGTRIQPGSITATLSRSSHAQFEQSRAKTDADRFTPLQATYAHHADMLFIGTVIRIRKQENHRVIEDIHPVFLDIEASGIHPEAYPIEIAWVQHDGRLERHLLDPSSVSYWTHWDPNAERLHGYSRESLMRRGEDPVQVALRIVEALGGARVYSDAPAQDGFWIEVLMAVAEERTGRDLPRLTLGHYLDLLGKIDGPRLNAAMRGARALAGPPHRADNDAQYLYELWRGLKSARSQD